MGNCLKSCLRTENPRISRNQCDPSKATTKSGMSSAPSTQTASSTPTTPTVPSYTRGSTRDYIPAPPTEGEILSSPNLKAFTFNELKSATRNFRPDSLIGEGGFGYVFKGWIDEQTLAASKPGAGMVVAVKKLKPEGFQGHSEWLTEVRYLGQLHHPNLVKLIGFCLDGDNRLLVYEYMPKGSLENHLFRRGPQPLSWDTRMKVAIGAARGLAFLHDAKSQVIYRDLKSSNILLDSDFHAKLSDFGLAKAGPTGDRTHVSTRIIGTQGYAAPEYIATGRLSAKSDVYSFGVVLLELLSGRPAYEKSKSGTEQSLVDWARPYLYDKRKLFLIMDSKLEGKFPKNVAHAMANLVSVCISYDPKLRPCMSEVLAVLEKLQDPKAAEKLIQTERAKSSKKSTKRCNASALQSTQGASPHRQTPRGGSPLQQIPGGSPLRQTPRGSPHRPTHRSPRRPTSGRSPLPSNTRSPRVH